MVEVKVVNRTSAKTGNMYEVVILDCDGYEIPLFQLNKEQVYLIKLALNKEFK